MPTSPVTIRTRGGDFTIPGETLEQFSLYSSYLVRKRGRWSGDLTSLHTDVERTLLELGVTDRDLNAVAESDVVEVSVPYDPEDESWAARLLPWEFVLTAVSKGRRDRPLLVVRHLAVPHQPSRRQPGKLLFVQNVSIGGYSFDEERKIVEAGLDLTKLPSAVNPTKTELRQRIQMEKPDVIHLSGVDLRQGRVLLALEPKPEEWLADGLYMADASGSPDGASAEELAKIINSADRAERPVLVCCNFYNSAAQIASTIVGGGTAAAIGFQDEFDDSLAERFFGRFYGLWQSFQWDLLSAFQESLQRMGNPHLRGTGLVLWSSHSLIRAARKQISPALLEQMRKDRRKPIESFYIPPNGEIAPGALENAGARKPVTRQPDDSSQFGANSGHTSAKIQAKPTLLKPSKTGNLNQPAGDTTETKNIRDLFAISVKPPRQINYSLLHNRERLFDVFTITKLRPGYVHGISIHVELFVGAESFPYRAIVDLAGESDVADLVNAIHVPLLSKFLRANREAVNTSLFVEIMYSGEILRRETFPVSLLGIDEWKFDPNDDSRWLASFVLPRDPAVVKIVNAAQRYVTALRDDVGAGFDGYQSVDLEQEDPDAAVDLQVRALWSALIHDFPLSYINPPPTFTENAQRLRTPTDSIEGNHGTCIDLALLLAACLEFVEIYPVIFVLRDHAFPGYWRNIEAHDRFLNVGAALTAGIVAAAEQKRSLAEYDEVMQLVNSGELVPLETVWLTQRTSFQEAVDAGMENLINRADFVAVVDIRRARKHGVTPLPVSGGKDW